jgi:hypothetical protein
MQNLNNTFAILCCFAAIIFYSDASSSSADSSIIGEKNNDGGIQEQQRFDDIEEQIRNYVKQVRAREQLEMLKAIRTKQILASIDPREYYEQQPSINNNNVQQIPSSDSESSPSADKRAQSFVRFGKRAQTFVRFGKRAQTFVRFGRDPSRATGFSN